MDNSLDAYRLKSTRSPAQEAGAFKTTGLDEYDDRGVGGAMGEDTIFCSDCGYSVKRGLTRSI
jgi:hypothetical protein